MLPLAVSGNAIIGAAVLLALALLWLLLRAEDRFDAQDRAENQRQHQRQDV